ncbi:hypothetical protein CEP54_006565 [Fusarium duplospermum]|uniref:beta-glucosidase n=1 Tax=Fusarium duplospermum TaxID=1325734 RepID=A0A428Q608_9HYPO|nr:hypothetical protein CEP54_006565 [Fusarium duplospermum]
MCSYNQVNGNNSCANSELMAILKEELAFPGYVVSDWYATHGTASHTNAGLDLEMPGNARPMEESRLGDIAERVLTPHFLLGQDDNHPTVNPASGASFSVYQYGHKSERFLNYLKVPARNVRGNHTTLIRQLGAAGTVLLKNNPEGFETGTVDIGGGSGIVRHTNLVTPLDVIRKHVEKMNGRVQVLLDNKELVDGRFRTIYPVPYVCLLFLKAYASEGQDRPSIDLAWNATKAVENTAAACPSTVVIMHGPGVVTMPWADNENVTAILSAHYPGEETGNSIVDVLWGHAEPSGRLPYTIPKKLADYGQPSVNLSQPVADPNAWQSDFDEGQMIDYGHFDANSIDPLFEFGSRAHKSKGVAPGGLNDLWTPVAEVTVEITNVGDSAGTAVPQLYVSLPAGKTPKGTPVRSLRGFEKLYLKPGQIRKVTFELKRRDLSFWDKDRKEWAIPEGKFIFAAGFSSRDPRAKVEATAL